MSQELSPETMARNTTRIPSIAYRLTGCIGVIGSNSLVLGPIAPEVAQSLSSVSTAVMMASSAYGLGTAASALFLARYIDRIGLHRMLRLSMILLTVALLASAIAPTVSMLVGAQFVAGLASGVALPAIYAGATVVSPAGLESRTIGVVLTGWTLSMVVGVSLSAYIADILNWRAVYLSVAMLSGVVTAAVTMPSLKQASAQTAPLPFHALQLPGTKPLLLACGCFMMAFYGMYGYLGDYLYHTLGVSLRSNGLIALCYGAGFGCAIFFNGIVDKVGVRRLTPLVFLAAAAVYFTLAVTCGYLGSVLALMFVLGMINHFGVNLLIMQLTAISQKNRGLLMGMNSAVTYLAVCTGTETFGIIYTRHGFSKAVLASMVLSLVAAMACAGLRPVGSRARGTRSTEGC